MHKVIVTLQGKGTTDLLISIYPETKKRMVILIPCAYKIDGFVKSPNVFVALHLSEFHVRLSTLHSTRFARLEFKFLYFAIPN